MKIYKITNDVEGYDVYRGHVIVANTVLEVIELAQEASQEEGREIWNMADIEECGEYTGKKELPFRLLGDFRAG